jgi:hypothetical protein
LLADDDAAFRGAVDVAELTILIPAVELFGDQGA